MRQSKATAQSARTGAPVSSVDHTAAANRSSTGILPPNSRESRSCRAGSAESIADTLQHWFIDHAADGFNVMPPYFHEGFEDFVQFVVPILQERGLFRADYEGTTLRGHLGLRRPENTLF